MRPHTQNVSILWGLVGLSDVSRLTLELRDRQARVDVLATKFETLASKNRATDPEGGEPKSQAYYIIKVNILAQDALWLVKTLAQDPLWLVPCIAAVIARDCQKSSNQAIKKCNAVCSQQQH